MHHCHLPGQACEQRVRLRLVAEENGRPADLWPVRARVNLAAGRNGQQLRPQAHTKRGQTSLDGLFEQFDLSGSGWKSLRLRWPT